MWSKFAALVIVGGYLTGMWFFWISYPAIEINFYLETKDTQQICYLQSAIKQEYGCSNCERPGPCIPSRCIRFYNTWNYIYKNQFRNQTTPSYVPEPAEKQCYVNTNGQLVFELPWKDTVTAIVLSVIFVFISLHFVVYFSSCIQGCIQDVEKERKERRESRAILGSNLARSDDQVLGQSQDQEDQSQDQEDQSQDQEDQGQDLEDQAPTLDERSDERSRVELQTLTVQT